MPLIFQKRIYREDLKANPHATYVFGDNELRKGLGGQAGEMRFEPNSFGIPTKKAPGTNPEDYWNDTELEHNSSIIILHIMELISKLNEGKVVVFPLDGIGTGLSALPTRAPKTYKFLEHWMNNLKKIYGVNK